MIAPAVASYWLPSITGMTAPAAAGLDELLARFHTASGEPARSIAVVGSSGNLLFRGNGGGIDAHDVVLRVNDAITAGYEPDVGSHGCDAGAAGTSREHVRVGFYAGLDEAAVRGQLCSGAFVAVTSAGGVSPQASDLRAAQRAGADGGVLISWDFMLAAQAAVRDASTGSSWPSTGFLALCVGLAVARHLGARVTAYGFGACEPCGKYCDCDGSNATRRRALGHATEAEARASEAAGSDGIHPFATEAAVRARWAADGHIALVEPTCDGFPSYDSPPSRPPPSLPPSPFVLPDKPVLFDDVEPLTVIGAAIVMLAATQAIQALREGCRRRVRRESAADGVELPECDDGSAYDLRANDAASAVRMAHSGVPLE